MPGSFASNHLPEATRPPLTWPKTILSKPPRRCFGTSTATAISPQPTSTPGAEPKTNPASSIPLQEIPPQLACTAIAPQHARPDPRLKNSSRYCITRPHLQPGILSIDGPEPPCSSHHSTWPLPQRSPTHSEQLEDPAALAQHYRNLSTNHQLSAASVSTTTPRPQGKRARRLHPFWRLAASGSGIHGRTKTPASYPLFDKNLTKPS